MPAPAAKPELKMNGWLTSVPWAEYLSQHGGLQEAAFGYNPQGNSATYSIFVPFAETVSAIEEILGNQYVEQVDPLYKRINRVLPVAHPHYYWLRAEKITSVKPVHFEEKGVLQGGTASLYTFALITIAFTHPKYVMLDDAALDRLYPPFVTVGGTTVRQEWQRFVEIRPEPAAETLSREKGCFKWAESDAGAGGPTAGQAVSAPIAQFLGKTNYVLVWRKVPAKFLFGSSGRNLVASSIEALVSRVNSEAFMGKATGTLLLQPPRFTPIEAPVPPEVVGANVALGEPGLLYDVELPMLNFEPPSGKGVYFGHNLAPFPGNSKWYLISSDGDPTTGQKILARGQFQSIFESA